MITEIRDRAKEELAVVQRLTAQHKKNEVVFDDKPEAMTWEEAIAEGLLLSMKEKDSL